MNQKEGSKDIVMVSNNIIQKYEKNILFSCLAILVILSCYLSRDIRVSLVYDMYEGASPEGLTTLYFDNGNGFEESDSDYQPIQNATVNFEFQPVSKVHGIRFIPTRIQNQTVSVNKICIFVDDTIVKTFSGDELYSFVSEDASAAHIELENESLLIGYKSNEPWAYVELSPQLNHVFNKLSLGTLCRALILFLIIALPVFILKMRYKLVDKWSLKIGSNETLFWVMSILFVLFWTFQKYLVLPLVLTGWLLPFMLGTCCTGERKIIFVFCNLLALGFSIVVLAFGIKPIFKGNIEYLKGIDAICIVTASWVGSISLWKFLYRKEKNCSSSISKEHPTCNLIYTFTLICSTFFIYEYVKRSFIISSLQINTWFDLMKQMTSPVYLMNIFWGTTFLLFLIGLCGRGLSTVLYSIIWFVVCLGNAIKIHYHNTLLTPMDFLQLKEMLRISPAILGNKVYWIIALLILIVVLLILTRKHWLSMLKPTFQWKYMIAFGFISISMTYMVIHDSYADKGIFHKGYENEFINERDDGVAFYNLINISKIAEIYMAEPENYTKENVDILKTQFRTDNKKSAKSNEKPNVILIMAESLFDIEGIEGLSFSEPIEPVLKKYKTGTLISPRFGGYTSAIEYEALTGLTLAFYPPALTPYTTYFNQPKKTIPSIVSEFEKNGYQTFAIHPNDKTFYNRDIAYQMLGFNAFLDKTDFQITAENTVANSFLKDMPIAERITALLSESDDPKFIFAVTIAGHYMSEDKYPNTTIIAQSSEMTEKELHEITQAATSYQETDKMFEQLVDYIQSSSHPTLLYIFGDHLPPFPIFNKISYTQDRYNKYGTTLSAYSNYKEIEMPEYITPNQLAAQIMVDSQIEYSSYYDYIYSLRDTYPIMHTEFINVNQSDDLNVYRLIQYDLMFGNQWFFDQK